MRRKFAIVVPLIGLLLAFPGSLASADAPPPEQTPLCSSHDPNVYHALYDPVRRCHYNHEHHANPATVNDLFGPPGAWYGQSGQSLSYPWQTFSGEGMESHLKHEGYKWIVARDLPCGAAATDCMSAYRIQVHAVAGAMDSTVRFHSFSIEALACPGGRCGIIRHGGWMDYGHLSLLTNGGDSDVCPPLDTNPPSFECGSGQRRVHSSLDHFAYFSNWYGVHHVTQPDLHFLEFGPIDYNDPHKQLFFPCPGLGCNFNGSVMRIENLGASTNYPWMNPDPNGMVNFRGYTDRYGDPVNGCGAPAVDCVPLEVTNLPAAVYGSPVDRNSDGIYWDTSPAAQGTGDERWITFPN